MESTLSKDLYEMNKEYLELKAKCKSTVSYKIKRIFKMIFSGNFLYLCDIVKSKIRKNCISGSNEELSLTDYEEFHGKIAIYTCIIGQYDMPLEPVYISDWCDYFIITDQPVDPRSAWQKIDVPDELYKKYKSNEINRYIKIHPHEFFREYEWSIYIDGNVRIISDLAPLIEKMGDSFLAVHHHSFRDCAFDEGKSFKHNKRLRSFFPAVKKQLDDYSKEGFPHHFGLYENTVLIRKHNEIICKDMMNDWWLQLVKYSFRDQISLPYIVWKNGIKSKIKDLGLLRNNYRFRMYGHN